MQNDSMPIEGNLAAATKITKVLLVDSGFLFQGIYPVGMPTQARNAICIRLFFEALFIITKY